MLKRLSVFTWGLFFFGLLAHNPMAFAAIECSGNPQEFKPTYSCINTDPTSHSSVTFRRMPAWGGNAGMVLIELCTVPDFGDVGQIKDDDEVVYAIGVDQDKPSIEGEEFREEREACIRRYCTEDMRQFSLAIDLFTIPIGYVFELGLTVGFAETDFRIECQSTSVREVL